MNSTRKLLIAAALAVAALLPAKYAEAASAQLCTPSAQSGSKRIVNPNTNAVYQTNGRGCAVFQGADVGYFQSQGFSVGPDGGVAIIYTTGVATGTTDFTIGSIPAGAYIKEIVYSNAVASAVTGGISIGTTANGTDVVAAQAVGSSALTFTPNASILKQVFSTTASTPLHAAAVTAWNSTNVTITVTYGWF
jgi:hypothetical protein